MAEKVNKEKSTSKTPKEEVKGSDNVGKADQKDMINDIAKEGQAQKVKETTKAKA